MRIKFWEAQDINWDGVWYRLVMRIAHKYHWHYAPPRETIMEGGKRHVWCKWCGLRSVIYEMD